MMSLDALRRVLAPLQRCVELMVGRCVLRAVTDTDGIQTARIGLLAGETRTGVERFQNYGFTSVPLPGAEGLAVFRGGSRDHGIIVAVDDRRYRLTGLADGEVALYTDEGDTIHLKRGKVIDVETDTLNINAAKAVNITTEAFALNAAERATATAPRINLNADALGLYAADGSGSGAATINADIQLNGSLTSTDDVQAGGISLENHVHPDVEPGDGTTGKPE